MNSSLENMVRFVQLTSSGLLAGSLGFGRSALVPGWESELPHDCEEEEALPPFFNAIGPIALASSVALAVASREKGAARKLLDVVSAVGLVGVVAATTLGTVPINKRLSNERPLDYPSDDALGLTKNWSRAHGVRRALGIGAFVAAVASTSMNKR